MDVKLDEKVIQRAISETTRDAKTLRFGFLTLLVGALLNVLLFIPFATLRDLAFPLGAGIALVAFLIPLVSLFTWNVVRVPFRQRNEAWAYIRRKEAVDSLLELQPFVAEGMAQLRVTNTGSSAIRCQGQMNGVSPSPSKPESIPYAIRWKGNAHTSSSTGVLEILGGSAGVLEVARQSSSNSKTRINEAYLLRSDGVDSRFRLAAEFGKTAIFEIEVLCDPPLPNPERCEYAIHIGAGGGISQFQKIGES